MAAQTIQAEYPDLYAYLLQRQVPANFVPNANRAAEVLATMMRLECRACQKQLPAENNHFRCSACRVARYCDKQCQARDWDTHRPVCSLDRVCREMFREGAYAGHLDQ